MPNTSPSNRLLDVSEGKSSNEQAQQQTQDILSYIDLPNFGNQIGSRINQVIDWAFHNKSQDQSQPNTSGTIHPETVSVNNGASSSRESQANEKIRRAKRKGSTATFVEKNNIFFEQAIEMIPGIF